jgi:hypothetical protein
MRLFSGSRSSVRPAARVCPGGLGSSTRGRINFFIALVGSDWGLLPGGAGPR